MKIAILGGGGFLGSYIVAKSILKYPESEIVILDYQPPNPDIPAFKSDKVEYVSGINILTDDYSDEIKNMDVLIYLVAIMKFGYRNKDDMYELNGEAVKRNLEIVERSNIKHLIFVSSIATVGSDPKGNWMGTEEKEVNWENKKFAYYGYSKQIGENYVKEAIDKNSIPKITIACPGILLGVNDEKMEPMYRMVDKLPILFSPPGGTNYVDVRDVASGILAIVDNGKHGEKYLLTNNDNNVKHGELMAEIGKAMGKKKRIIYLPRFLGFFVWNLMRPFEIIQPKSSKATKEGIWKSFIKRYFDNTLTMEKLDWSPQYTLLETLVEVVNHN